MKTKTRRKIPPARGYRSRQRRLPSSQSGDQLAKLFNFNDLSVSQLRDILTKLNAQEISLLCGTNRKINSICEDEEFWKNVVFQQYGIEKKYGVSWRKTAMNMAKSNMINLNKKWYDGRTYGEIFDEVKDTDRIYRSQVFYLQNFFGVRDDLIDDVLTLYLGEYDLQDTANEEFDETFTDEAIDGIFDIVSKEINVIKAAINAQQSMYRNYDYLPGYDGPENALEIKNGLRKDYHIRRLIDPVLYLMQYSMFSEEMLQESTL